MQFLAVAARGRGLAARAARPPAMLRHAALGGESMRSPLAAAVSAISALPPSIAVAAAAASRRSLHSSPAPSSALLQSLLQRVAPARAAAQAAQAAQAAEQRRALGPGYDDSLPFHIQRLVHPPDRSYGSRFRWSATRFLHENLRSLWFRGLLLAFMGTLYYYDVNFEALGAGPAAMFSMKQIQSEIPKTRLKDVVGCDEAKAEVAEVVEFLKNPSKFNKLGGRMTKGTLLLGPPGTGKTLLARAIAGEAGVPFFAVTGADFEEKYVGVGAKRVRELFAAARKVQPSIIFIDEIDTVGGKRNDFDHPKARMSLNELLGQMDGFDTSNSQVIVMAATNFADRLDPALLRPGRFDRHVTVPVPDIKGRREILQLYANKMKLSPSIDLGLIARSTAGMTGAELFHLLNSAALHASTLNKPVVDTADVEWSRDKILMGAERSSGVTSDEIRRHVATYEGGKSLMALLTPNAVPLHKVTILQRGQSLGNTALVRAQDDDKTSESYLEMIAHIDTSLAGRAAEELLYGADGVSSHAEGDLARASKLARVMVSKLGFGASVGPMSQEQWSIRAVAPGTKRNMDAEVEQMLQASYERVKAKLQANEPALKRVTEALLKYEVLDNKQLKQVVEGEPIQHAF